MCFTITPVYWHSVGHDDQSTQSRWCLPVPQHWSRAYSHRRSWQNSVHQIVPIVQGIMTNSTRVPVTSKQTILQLNQSLYDGIWLVNSNQQRLWRLYITQTFKKFKSLFTMLCKLFKVRFFISQTCSGLQYFITKTFRVKPFSFNRFHLHGYKLPIPIEIEKSI